MRPSPSGPLGRVPWLMLALLFLMSACDRHVPTRQGIVRRISLAAPSLELRPGFSMTVVAAALDASDAPVDVPVVWRSETPTLLSVDVNGVLLALAPGEGVVRASVGSVSAVLAIALVNPPAATLSLEADSVTLLLPDGGGALVVTAADAAGVPIVGAALQWTSSAARIATVSPLGGVTPLAVGQTTVTVTMEGLRDSVVVSVGVTATASAPVITSVLPLQMQPGVPVVLTGERFAATIAGNTVHVDGLPVSVTAASVDALTLLLPLGTTPCLPTRPVALQVATSGGIGVTTIGLRVAPRLALLPGEAFVGTTASAGACQELAFDDGEYLLSITHAGRALGGGPIAVTLAGRVAPGAIVGSAPAVASPIAGALAVSPGARAGDRSGDRALLARRMRAHHELLRASRDELIARRPRLDGPERVSGEDASLQLPALGGIVNVRVPDLDSPAFCVNFRSVGARTVFAGANVVILEDTATTAGGAPTVAGAIDDMIIALGTEVETAIWPLLSRFGDPLVMDSRLDANGRIAILLTPQLNAMRAGAVLGAVVSCDFFPRAQLPSSNVGEILYLQVPTTLDPGFSIGTRDRWRWEIRSVIAHELKHVVSFGQRIVRGQPLEELWLEEATARHAEELYARTLYAAVQGADAMYAATLRCEAREAGLPAGCADVPRVMRSHFEGLYEYLDAPLTHSPLGGSSAADLSFYGSAWALTRWAFDQSTRSETALLSGLTTSGQSGVANLEGRIGLPWDVMLSLWSLAMLTDGAPGVTVSSPQLAFPSWDLADVFAGLCADVGPCASGGTSPGLFGRAHPSQPLARSTGDFDLTFPEITPGGFASVRLSGSVSSDAQLVELRGVAGTLPPSARLSILRVR